MSYQTTQFRPYARNDWRGRQASAPLWMGTAGTVVYRGVGARQAYELVGVSRDSVGAPLAACLLILFDTATDRPLQRVVSDSGGAFRFDNPGVGPFYIVLYKSGTQVGTSANALRPTIQLQPTPPVALAGSTTFSLTENPINESGGWRGGLTHGTDWQNMQTGSGNAYGVGASPTGYDDNVACRTGAFTRSQFVEGVIWRASGYSPSIVHEIELMLHCTIAANNITAYELLMNSAGNFALARWDGTVGNVFFGISPTNQNGGPVGIVNGDVIRFSDDGAGNFTMKQNGVVVWTFSDATWQAGSPGMASFWRPDASIVPASFGFQSLSWGNGV